MINTELDVMECLRAARMTYWQMGNDCSWKRASRATLWSDGYVVRFVRVHRRAVGLGDVLERAGRVYDLEGLIRSLEEVAG